MQKGLTGEGNRSTYGDVPWLDHHGFEERMRTATYHDPQGWDNFKQALVNAPDHDGRPGQRWIVTTARSESGTITSFIERIDEFGRAVRAILPGRVIERINRQTSALQAENKSRKAREITPPARKSTAPRGLLKTTPPEPPAEELAVSQ